MVRIVQYDDLNTVAQGAYSLTNLRAGVTIKSFVVEAFMRNAFDERYIPVLFPYADFAPSGFSAKSERRGRSA